MSEPKVHIIGAGLAGLSAAVRLCAAGVEVVLHEAANQAGGRCRSYFDATLGMNIDNGNHLVLSGNRSAMGFVTFLGAKHHLVGPEKPEFPFVDLANGERWVLRPGLTRLPWWIFSPSRRIPGTKAKDYGALAQLLKVRPGATIGDVIPCRGKAYTHLVEPLLVAALNTDPPVATASLASAIVRETFGAGGTAIRPLIARDGLSTAFVDPALEYLAREGAEVRFGHRLRAITYDGGRATALDFTDDVIPLGPKDRVVLAVPPVVAAAIVPELETPREFRAIVNAHFATPPPDGAPPLVGVVNAKTQWVFAFPDRLSVTISNADHLLDLPREQLAQEVWEEVCRALDIAAPLPAWQIIRERRATFAAIPAEEQRRPPAPTRWDNLVLAGDWTDTGLPATIEGAIRSGNLAARLTLARI